MSVAPTVSGVRIHRLQPPVAAFMAECFWPGVTEQHLLNAGARARQAAGAGSSDGGFARYMGSILVPSDEIAFCLLYTSPSPRD